MHCWVRYCIFDQILNVGGSTHSHTHTRTCVQTHTHTQPFYYSSHYHWSLLQPFYGPLSGTTWVSRYQKKHSSTHCSSDYQPSFISFLHLLQPIACFLFTLCAWQSFCTTSPSPLWSASWSVCMQAITKSNQIYMTSRDSFILLHVELLPLSPASSDELIVQGVNISPSSCKKFHQVDM